MECRCPEKNYQMNTTKLFFAIAVTYCYIFQMLYCHETFLFGSDFKTMQSVIQIKRGASIAVKTDETAHC